MTEDERDGTTAVCSGSHQVNYLLPSHSTATMSPAAPSSPAPSLPAPRCTSGVPTVLSLLVSALLLPLAAAEAAAAPSPADKIFHNATFFISFAGSADDSSFIRNSTALAVASGRVVYHGNLDTARRLHSGPSTEFIDLGGHTVIPGLIDSHVHFIDGGMQLAALSLRDLRTPREFSEAVREAVEKLSPGQWLLGHGWNENKWTNNTLGVSADDSLELDSKVCTEETGSDAGDECVWVPSNAPSKPEKSWIDEFSQQNPILLTRVDGHVALANSAALQLAGVSESSLDPDGGELGRDSSGILTGILQESAIGLVSAHVPVQSVEDRRLGLLKAQMEALRHGVTAVVDFGRYYPGSTEAAPWNDLEEVYLEADRAGEMKVRVHCVLPLAAWQRLRDWIREKGHRSNSSFLHWGLLKAFADGSVGSRTALFSDAYADTPTRGIQLLDFDWLSETIADVMRSDERMGVSVHAIGDAAVSGVLASIKAALKQSLSPEAHRRSGTSSKGGQTTEEQRWLRIEHAQHILGDSAHQFQELSVYSSMQPYHMVDDIELLSLALGEERAKGASYRFQSLARSAPALALGSDWPVVNMDPFEGMLAAGHWKKDLQEWDLLNTGEALDLLRALRGYTSDAAKASNWDGDMGSLDVGYFADMVVLDSKVDVLEAGKKPAVLKTFVGGALVLDIRNTPGY